MPHIQQLIGSSSGGISASAYTTQSKSADFTAAVGFLYLIDSTSGTIAVALPSANVSGQTFAVKWAAGTNAVTLNRAGSDTIGPSATSATMGLTNEVWEFVSSGSGQWNLVGGNKTLSSLDIRYYAPNEPVDHGYLSWSLPIYAAQSSSLLSLESGAGTLRLSRNRRVPAGPVTNLVIYVATAGSGLTSGQCFATLYDTSGNLLGVTANQSVAWASAGLKSMAIAGGPVTVTAGDYYVGLWYNGTTAPVVMRGGLGADGTQSNANQSSSNYDTAYANTGLTTTAPNPFGAKTASALLWWTALS